ncbi:hypothetical protein F4777DRAFT_375430 [Nemania sp. FL0916]|nr:hypothetical protein F4777DRAFT_375430 [Nemania sp. FL0916]
MGGQAFASGPDPIFTPRMKPDVYHAVRDRCQEKLRELFVVVTTPIDGPAKTSFGDVDFFVTWEKRVVFPSLGAAVPGNPSEDIRDIIARHLDAVGCKRENANITTLAIPWPEDFAYSEVEAGSGPSSSAATPEPSEVSEISGSNLRLPHIQVDVHVCSTLMHMQWMLFKTAHGDLWNLLGSMIRPLGLTIDEVGLYLRIPEIEKADKKKAKVLLTKDPGAILTFLGLKFDSKEWEKPFASEADLFEYAASCRLFSVKTENTYDDGNGKGDGDDDKDDQKVAMTTNTAGTIDRRKLKSNDRKRMNGRPLFRRWIDEFIPACRATGRFLAPTPPLHTRASVRSDAFACFPGAEEAYATQLNDWLIAKQRQTLWNDVIKPAVPHDAMPGEPHKRACCVGALKKIIIENDADAAAKYGGVSVDQAALHRADGSFDEDAVRAWVAGHWEVVSEAAWEIQLQRFIERQNRIGATKKEKDSGAAKSGGTAGSSPAQNIPMSEAHLHRTVAS